MERRVGWLMVGVRDAGESGVIGRRHATHLNKLAVVTRSLKGLSITTASRGRAKLVLRWLPNQLHTRRWGPQWTHGYDGVHRTSIHARFM